MPLQWLTKAKKDKPQGYTRYCIKQINQIIEKEVKNGWSQTRIDTRPLLSGDK